MKREFFLNIVFLILANIIIKPIYLLWVEVEVNNIVGPSTYGIYAAIFSLCYIFQIIADPGLLNYNTTQIASDRTKVFARVPAILGLKLILAVAFAIALYIAAFFSGYSNLQWEILPWVLGNLLLISFILYLRSNISALGKYRWDSFFSILDKTLMILILVYMIYFSSEAESFNILDFVQGQMIAYGISFLVIMIFLAGLNIRITPDFDFKLFQKLLQQSLPFAWLLFLMTIYTRVDTYMLEILVDDNGYQAGVYASAFRLFDAGNSFSYLFAVLLLPIFTNMLASRESVKNLYLSTSSFLFSGIVIICVFMASYDYPIMQFFYPNDATTQYAHVFSLLMYALIPMSMAYITGSLLTAATRLKELNKMALIGVIANIMLNIILIKQLESVGAAISTMITQAAMFAIQMYYISKFFHIRPTSSSIMRHLAFVILVILIALMGVEFSPLESWVNFVLGIIISIICALLLRLIRLDVFQSILKSRFSPK